MEFKLKTAKNPPKQASKLYILKLSTFSANLRAKTSTKHRFHIILLHGFLAARKQVIPERIYSKSTQSVVFFFAQKLCL